ncbi:MAG: hypothetical protein ACSLE6_09120 [Mycobacterium sp.]
MVETYLQRGHPLGDLVSWVLAPGPATTVRGLCAEASAQWTELEEFLESRFRDKRSD